METLDVKVARVETTLHTLVTQFEDLQTRARRLEYTVWMATGAVAILKLAACHGG